MNVKKSFESRIRGWLPKEPSLSCALKAPKPRWRNPYWISFTLVAVVAMAAVTFVGVRAYIHYSNPGMDVAPIPIYEKTTNSTTVGFGDIVEVNVWVYWHGYVFPEFKRNVKIADQFPESYFSLASENETNVHQFQGYGGSYHVKYLLRTVGGNGESVEFPEPRLYLDSVEIPLSGTSPTLDITSK